MIWYLASNKSMTCIKKINIKASDGYVLSGLVGIPAIEQMGVVVISSATCTKKRVLPQFCPFFGSKWIYGFVI